MNLRPALLAFALSLFASAAFAQSAPPAAQPAPAAAPMASPAPGGHHRHVAKARHHGKAKSSCTRHKNGKCVRWSHGKHHGKHHRKHHRAHKAGH